jgi:lipoprotein-anchoring transpeptidase ErfK/SrfK
MCISSDIIWEKVAERKAAVKTKTTDEKLEQFFREDPLYLKKYVKEHPENKMAWYLLGREYEAQGKQGKALYCYSQAGEIYEAFENQRVELPAEELKPLEQWRAEQKRRARRSRLRLWMTVLASLMIALYIPPIKPEIAVESLPLPANVTVQQAQQTQVYYLTGDKSKSRVAAALQNMLLQERIQRLGILVRGAPLGNSDWISWSQKPEPLLSVEAGATGAQQQISYYDQESCQCEPGDSSMAAGILPVWQLQQEQELVVRSAVIAYRDRNGSIPEELSQVSQPYPNNMLPGVSEAMQTWYAREKEKLSAEILQQGKPSASPKESQGNNPSPSGELTKPFTEPLRIIVDKKTYRLAVVSGKIVLRSYPVGLGGARTPEGEFTISEKVRNPNGKSNGEFGSRGMTLSDTLYAIHGTNKPASIGKDQSLGCVRMLKEDVEELFDMVPLGTSVTIGSGLLPSEVSRSPQPWRLPQLTEESNPGKVYKWLN